MHRFLFLPLLVVATKAYHVEVPQADETKSRQILLYPNQYSYNVPHLQATQPSFYSGAQPRYLFI